MHSILFLVLHPYHGDPKAEARLAARKQARAEAREIRMREMEKQQKENDETSDRHYELLNGGSSLTNGDSYGRSSSVSYARNTPLIREVSHRF